MHKKTQSAFLTADQAWDIIGRDTISRRTLYNALKRSEIPSRRLGRRLIIPRHAFEEWIKTSDVSGYAPQ